VLPLWRRLRRPQGSFSSPGQLEASQNASQYSHLTCSRLGSSSAPSRTRASCRACELSYRKLGFFGCIAEYCPRQVCVGDWAVGLHIFVPLCGALTHSGDHCSRYGAKKQRDVRCERDGQTQTFGAERRQDNSLGRICCRWFVWISGSVYVRRACVLCLSRMARCALSHAAV